MIPQTMAAPAHFVLPPAALAAFAIAALTSLGACAQTAPVPPSPTVGQRVDSAIEKSKEVANEVKDKAVNAAKAVSATSTDVAITTQVKATLATDSELSALAINVDTTLAKEATGVVGVKNNLTLVTRP